MIFNKVTHQIILDSMDKVEAKMFVVFLYWERDRQERAMGDCKAESLLVEKSKSKKVIAMRAFWESQALRHQDKINDIDELIPKVKEMYKL